MVAWARKHGIQSTIHTGGPSIPGSGLIDKDVVLEADADVIGHINGGHTALPERTSASCARRARAPSRSCTTATSASRSLARAGRAAAEVPAPRDPGHRLAGRLGRAAAGHAADDRAAVEPGRACRPSWRSASPPATPRACAASNCGLIEPGRAADFVFMDRAQHTAGPDLLDSVRLGDMPGIGMVMIDGIVRCGRSRNTPPATEVPVVVGAPERTCTMICILPLICRCIGAPISSMTLICGIRE